MRAIKTSTHLTADASLVRDIQGIASFTGLSLSSCVEAMLLMISRMCELEGDQVVYDMRRLKAERLLKMPSLKAFPPKSRCHLCLSKEALSFAQLLHQTYPPVFGCTGEVIELCMLYCRGMCGDDKRLRYLSRRLLDISRAE